MCLKLILPWGTKAGQLVLRYDLAQYSYFMCFSGASRTQRKLLGKNIRELLWVEGKHCQRNQLRRGKELKRFAPSCTEAGYSVSNHGCWADFFYYNICGCSQARSAYSHSEDLILVFISIFWVTTLFKQTVTCTSLPWICFLLLRLVPLPVSLPFPLTHFVVSSGSKIYLFPLASASCFSHFRQVRSTWVAYSSLSFWSIHSTQLWQGFSLGPLTQTMF